MNKRHLFNNPLFGNLFFSKPDDANGGAPAINTLAEAKSRITKLEGDAATHAQAITSLTSAKEKAEADLQTANSTISTITGERDKAQADLGTANTALAQARKDHTAAATNVNRLEKFCGVHGVSIVDLAEVNTDASNAREKHVLDKYLAATGAEKAALFRDNKAEIRAEAIRRAAR